jgi:hypothetical protein
MYIKYFYVIWCKIRYQNLIRIWLIFMKWLPDWLTVLVDICPTLAKVWIYSNRRNRVLTVATIHIKNLKFHIFQNRQFPKSYFSNSGWWSRCCQWNDRNNACVRRTLWEVALSYWRIAHRDKFVSAPEATRRMSSMSQERGNENGCYWM